MRANLAVPGIGRIDEPEPLLDCQAGRSGAPLLQRLRVSVHVRHVLPHAIASATIDFEYVTQLCGLHAWPQRNDTETKAPTVFWVKQPGRHRHALVPGTSVHFGDIRRQQICSRHAAVHTTSLSFLNQGVPICMDRIQCLGEPVFDPILGVEDDQAFRTLQFGLLIPDALPNRAS